MLLLLFLFLAQVESCRYHFRYLDPQPNHTHIGEPIRSRNWPRANLHEKPAAHLFVDENKNTICLEDVEKKENYRIKTLVTYESGYEYMYMTDYGTNTYFYNIYLNTKKV